MLRPEIGPQVWIGVHLLVQALASYPCSPSYKTLKRFFRASEAEFRFPVDGRPSLGVSVLEGNGALQQDSEDFVHDDFRRLIQPLESRLARAVWRVLQHADDADDALQDALSRIWTRIADVRSHANPEAFILRIALSSAHDVLRRRVRRRKIGDDGTADFDRVPSHDREGDPLEGAEVRGRVLAAVADLPTMQAEAFLLRVVDERSYAEIASALAVGESTARTHVERARRQLEKRLRPNFAERAEERP